MKEYRRNAIAVGALYIAATIAGILSVGVLGSLFSDQNMLTVIDSDKNQLLLVALLELVMAITVAGVAFFIYPVLKHDSDTKMKEGLAVWYLGSRITEGALFLIGILFTLLLIPLSQEFVGAGSPDLSFFKTASSMLKVASEYSWMLGQTVFCIGAVMLYYLLYVSKRVPRWLSVWGLIGAPLMLIAGFLVLFTGDSNSTASTALYAPLALQEMVLAFWLIFKGFNPTEKDSKK